MNRPNIKNYLYKADFKESLLSAYTDYYSYTHDLEKYCDELEKTIENLNLTISEEYNNPCYNCYDKHCDNCLYSGKIPD